MMKYPLSDEQLDALCRRLHCKLNDPQLLCLALTHRSCAGDNNERLEFLGDSILNAIIAEELYIRHPAASEGELSRMRAYLVKGETLTKIAKTIDLGEYLLLGQGERKSGGARRASILADCFEAVTAAIFLDQGYAVCRQMVLHCYQDRLSTCQSVNELKDAKTRLQEFLQSKNLSLPMYSLVQTRGKEHQQLFEISCHVPGIDLTTCGSGYTRRKAEKEAAERMLRRLEARH